MNNYSKERIKNKNPQHKFLNVHIKESEIYQNKAIMKYKEVNQEKKKNLHLNQTYQNLDQIPHHDHQ